MPLRGLGSEFFWVWPVISNGRLSAVLAVGFREAPTPDPRFARHGSEFASRLAIALSKTARDEHLYRQAHFDPLTGLPNRLLFRDRLTQEVASCAETRTRGALLYIDLDHFKKVNDSVGHAAGDQLLTIIAQRLRACVKEGDTVARLAGDEFTVILRNVTDPESASLVGERIIESVKQPVNLAGRDHYVQASIGIVLFPDDGSSIEELMRRADGAMYRAKDLGRGRAVFYDRALMMNRFETSQSGLYRALRRREFSLFYQPQFESRRRQAGRARGAAALADAARRHALPGRLHPRGRGQRPDRRHRRLGHRGGLRAAGGVARAGHRAGAPRDQRLGAAAEVRRLPAQRAAHAREVRPPAGPRGDRDH